MLIITGTGRSGTASLAKLLAGRHEFRAQYLLDKYFSKAGPHLNPFDTLEKRLAAILDLHQGIDPATFTDSSNLYIHFIDAIFVLNPSVKFILSVRNGRDFVRSACSRGWHEKSSFGNVPQAEDPYFEKWASMTPVQRNAWIWTYRNQKALEGLKHIPEDQKLILRIEDLCRKETLAGLESFAGRKIREDADPGKKYNANPSFTLSPKEVWTERMNREFFEIAGDLMKQFGYE